MCLWRTFVAEREVINQITFSAVHTVHGLPLSGRLSTEPVSQVTLAVSEVFVRSNVYVEIIFNNFCAMYPLSRYTFFYQNTVFLLNGMFANIAMMCKIKLFILNWKLESKVSK